MKKVGDKTLTLVLAIFIALTLGCSSKRISSGDNSNGQIGLGDSDRGNGGEYTDEDLNKPDTSGWGAEAELQINSDAFRDWAGYYPDKLVGMKVFLNIDRHNYNGNNVYAGDLRLLYWYDKTQGAFDPQPGKVDRVYKHPRFEARTYSSSELQQNPKHLTQAQQGVRFNRFYPVANGEKFVGFFEEPGFYSFSQYGQNPNTKVGALMIVMDNFSDDTGYKGDVYYINYRFAPGIKPLYTRCWDISHPDSPYNCQEFIKNQTVDPLGTNFSITRYRKLGSFYGMPEASVNK